jgi:hypothetical protein
VHFSVQNDHIHFIVEAAERSALIHGVQGLTIRLARGINRTIDSKGRVWGDRYHSRELKTPREVRHAVVYVLMNAKKHGLATPPIDPFSSAPWCDGIRGNVPPDDASPVMLPRTWLGGVGWRRRGLIEPHEKPS